MIIPSPSPADIKSAREKIQERLGLGITEAKQWCAALIYKGLRTWQQWENGDRKMDPAFWELFLIKTETGAQRNN